MIRPPDAPTISVVVASNRDRALLDACLGSLRPQCTRAGAELIVARAGLDREASALRRAFPGVRFVSASEDASIPQLRAIGMAEASGDIVALTEDHCVADEHWLETLTRHAGEGADVVGGGMENAQRARSVDWGAYFAEYGFFAPARRSDEMAVPLLTAANVAYHRRVVDQVVALARQDQWENVAHERLMASGSILRFASTAAIYQNQNYSFGPFCANRYEHGRDYARKRLTDAPEVSRLLHLVGSPLLPFVLTWRVAQAAGRHRMGTFIRALPATFAFLTAWSIGEAVGYLRGALPEDKSIAG
ncbi:MAG: glycosyltransferase [Gemmatimonadota bacterium]|nr:glycosyltransferase [Gemmatimonadota bacterium]